MTFDPLAASSQIDEAYRRYLRSLLPLRDPALAAALDDAIENSSILTKGPLLETTPAYAPGASIADLVDEGVLSHELLTFTSRELPSRRSLYRHQEQAIRKAAAGRNIVVATGTGSGKTESFLLPVLDHLARERAEGTLGPGIRALLLYPMNALANDQMKRLRRLLAAVPDVTFGRYTGDTDETTRRAEERFHQLNPGEPRLPNELLSREEMRARPPHLLLTNYAMLEYLLLRPRDMDLFDGPHAGQWKYIVLDEAHVYDGAKGAELAMLLRRLRDRVGATQDLQAIATSATVGSDRDPAAVTDFATALFGLPFDWNDTDANRQDVVGATVRRHVVATPWGPLPASAYSELVSSPNPEEAVLAAAHEHGWNSDPDAASALAAEARLVRLRELLRNGPRPLSELATTLFEDEQTTSDDAAAALTSLVMLGNRMHGPDGSPLLSTRYHLFARATEGAFSCLDHADPHLSLSRRERCDRCSRVVFELGGCRRCGAVHLHGALDTSGPVARHIPWRTSIDRNHAWLLLEDADLGDSVAAEDEDDTLLEGGNPTTASHRYLCITCGALHSDQPARCSATGCVGTDFRRVRLIDVTTETLNSCIACGSTATIRLFESGNEAAVSVIGTSLYQSLPGDTESPAGDLPGEGRKLLFFSDSRQMAAYFAPYLEDTHERLVRRRLIMMSLHKHAEQNDGEAATIEDVVEDTIRAATRAHIFDEDRSRSSRRRDVSRWVMQEVLSYDERQSLEGTGLLRIELVRKSRWQPLERLTSLGLTSDESWHVIQELLRTLRMQGVIDVPEDIEADDEVLAPRRGPIYMRGQGSEPKKKVLSWLPTSGSNSRIDYLTRVLARLGGTRDPKRLLDGLWSDLDPTQSGDGPHTWLRPDVLPRLGTVRRINHRKIRIRPIAEDEEIFQCDRCHRMAGVSVRGVCPTHRCDGRLVPWRRPDLSAERNHYRHLYLASLPVPMSVQEHTAQWTSQRAAEIQGQFVRGEVNALSCSTTFELGVDVGELQAVVLRNMPPTTANYVQRAGRAGRRSDAAALVVTFAQRRSHDLSRFNQPEKMISGETRVPSVPLNNVRIDRRHAHSVALAAFFRAMKEERHQEWRSAGDFFLAPDPAPSDYVVPCARVRNFLSPVPDQIRVSLEAVLPSDVGKEIGLDDDSWVDELVRLLDDARLTLEQDVLAFSARKKEAVRQENYGLAKQCQKVLETLHRRPLLGFLANHSILPKYGFPVDTVELRTDGLGGRGDSLELTRDLSMAISEYAPGSQVIAGGMRWSSGGVYRLPGRDLVTRYYLTCDRCGHYRESVDIPEPRCPSCGKDSTRAASMYAEPSYGFVATRAERQGSAQAPRRSGSVAKYIVDTRADVVEGVTQFPAGGTVSWRAGARGQFAVINEGPKRSGFYLCQTCGWGAPAMEKPPRAHPHLLKTTSCRGSLRRCSLAHRYETDFVELHLEGPASLYASPGNYRSAVYALLEGSSAALEISRDDIDGTVNRGADGRPSLVLFDTTPGGAGNAIRIADNLLDVVTAAMARVAHCECGEETSCYGCLRSFANDRYHSQLSRRSAIELLQDLVPTP